MEWVKGMFRLRGMVVHISVLTLFLATWATTLPGCFLAWHSWHSVTVSNLSLSCISLACSNTASTSP